MSDKERSIAPIDITNYDWGRRIFEPNPPFLQNPDGSISTHLMAAETDEKGNWWAFPTIVRDGGSLMKLSPEAAFTWNLLKGEAVPFGKDKDTALWFAKGGYKQGTPIK